MLMAVAEGHKCFFCAPGGSRRDCSWLHFFLDITLHNFLLCYFYSAKKGGRAKHRAHAKGPTKVLEEQCATGGSGTGGEESASVEFVIGVFNFFCI